MGEENINRKCCYPISALQLTTVVIDQRFSLNPRLLLEVCSYRSSLSERWSAASLFGSPFCIVLSHVAASSRKFRHEPSSPRFMSVRPDHYYDLECAPTDRLKDPKPPPRVCWLRVHPFMMSAQFFWDFWTQSQSHSDNLSVLLSFSWLPHPLQLWKRMLYVDGH